jgi:hypothetical protein
MKDISEIRNSQQWNNVLDEKSWDALDAFTSRVNMSDNNPFDVERWYAFVIAIYRSGAKIETSEIRSLMSEIGWPSDYAKDWIGRFEEGMILLSVANSLQ